MRRAQRILVEHRAGGKRRLCGSAHPEQPQRRDRDPPAPAAPRGLDGSSVYGAMASPRVWCSSTPVQSRPPGHTSLLRWPPAAERAGSATNRCRLLPARPHGARDLGPCAGQTHAAPTRPGSWDAGPPGPPTRRPGGPNAPTRVAAHQRRPPQGADTPRSAHTSTIQPWGIAGRRRRHSRSPAPPSVCGAGGSPGMRRDAPGSIPLPL